MKYEQLLNCILFDTCDIKEIKTMYEHLQMHIKTYKKNETIYRNGDSVQEIGIVLKGKIQIESSDIWGNKNIINIIEEGDIFAESYATSQTPILVDVIALEKSEIVFLNIQKLLSMQGCTCHEKVIHNLLMISTNKNIHLSNRMFLTSKKTIRERVMAYVSMIATKQQSNHITLPLNREQMASYLNLDRSALSKELMKMKQEGILDYHKNHFILYQTK